MQNAERSRRMTNPGQTPINQTHINQPIFLS
jgi:hypothetical protein